jgi:mono/diheme cytochrome c family protein
MSRKAKFVGLAMVVFMGAVFFLMFTGNPRMEEQANIRSFQARMPTMPAGLVAVRDVVPRIPTTAQAEELARLDETPANLQAARVYYGYYCVFCHGQGGDGDGPVGLGFVPNPPDFRLRVRDYSPGQIYRAMLTGAGHEPMLNRIVPTYARPYLVLYVRHLSLTPSALPSDVQMSRAATQTR